MGEPVDLEALDKLYVEDPTGWVSAARKEYPSMASEIRALREALMAYEIHYEGQYFDTAYWGPEEYLEHETSGQLLESALAKVPRKGKTSQR